jgi:hypothetical protein
MSKNGWGQSKSGWEQNNCGSGPELSRSGSAPSSCGWEQNNCGSEPELRRNGSVRNNFGQAQELSSSGRVRNSRGSVPNSCGWEPDRSGQAPNTNEERKSLDHRKARSAAEAGKSHCRLSRPDDWRCQLSASLRSLKALRNRPRVDDPGGLCGASRQSWKKACRSYRNLVAHGLGRSCCLGLPKCARRW